MKEFNNNNFKQCLTNNLGAGTLSPLEGHMDGHIDVLGQPHLKFFIRYLNLPILVVENGERI